MILGKGIRGSPMTHTRIFSRKSYLIAVSVDSFFCCIDSLLFLSAFLNFKTALDFLRSIQKFSDVSSSTRSLYRAYRRWYY